MRLSFVAFAGLIVFGSNLGVQSRAIPNEVSLSSNIHLQNTQTLKNDDSKRRLSEPIPRPITIRSTQPASPPVKKPASPPAKKPASPPAKKPASPPAKKPVPSKPLPGKETPQRGVCLAKPKKKGAVRRATYTKADSEDVNKVYQWLLENETRLKGEDTVKERLVFYVSGGGEGKEMARKFLEKNPSYAWYNDIFLRSAFVTDFKGADARHGPRAEAASEALALWARNPIVFNSDKAYPESFWFKHELLNMYNAGSITKMKDNALKPTETAGTIPVPPRPAC